MFVNIESITDVCNQSIPQNVMMVNLYNNKIQYIVPMTDCL